MKSDRKNVTPGTLEKRLAAFEREAAATGGVYAGYVRHAAAFLLRMIALEKSLSPRYFKTATFEELLAGNHRLYSEVLPERYNSSYADPVYCASKFGRACGPAISAHYAILRSTILSAYAHEKDDIADAAVTSVRLFEHLLEGRRPRVASIGGIMADHEVAAGPKKTERFLRDIFDPSRDRVADIVRSHSTRDLRYLFRYGCYIGMNEIRSALHIASLDAASVRRLARSIARAYIQGFSTENKDRGSRDVVRVIAYAGCERIVSALMDELGKLGMSVTIPSVSSMPFNRQYSYDHRFDEKLFMSAGFVRQRIGDYAKAFAKVRDLAAGYSGHIRISQFGEEPFSPADREGCFALGSRERELSGRFDREYMMLYSKNVPGPATSFCAVALPSPAIGDDFEKIFGETVRINTIDTAGHMRIQQRIVDALDAADHVRVRGAGKNRTDLVVKMPALRDPATQTNFYNCGADVNIPVGEVFTTPCLRGTDGKLHIEEAYLDGYDYFDLELVFRDGIVVDYSCGNFDDTARGRRYIEENLFSLQKDLPMGEFAIGTNTAAFAMAQRFGIMKKLPVLIAEKLGPHFAIGDTCYPFVEDIPVYNPFDGKEIVARENERTALRSKDPEKAYCGVHMDITLPYASIGVIEAVPAKGPAVAILRNGRFALAGCGALNGPLEGLF